MKEDIISYLKRYQQEYPATARLDYYLKAAQARKATATDDETKVISALEIRVQRALQALSDGDFDLFAQAFEQVVRRTVELNLPDYETEIRSQAGKKANEAKQRKHDENREKIDQYMIELYENSKFKGHPFSAAGSIKLQNQVNARAKELGIDKIMTKRIIHRVLDKHHHSKNKS